MPYSSRFRSTGYSYSGYFPLGVKWLLIVNVALFLAYFFARLGGFGFLFEPFKLRPIDILDSFAIWQFVTYLFLHDPGGFGHILFNMLALWMFGADLERDWGTKRFLQFYFICGIGAGVCVVLANLLFGGDLRIPTIGASGAIYGLLLAFGMLYPDRIVLFSFLFPIKAKYFVMIIGAVTFLSSLGSTGTGVSHIAHLGGMIFGYLYLRTGGVRIDFISPLMRRYQQWKLQRAKRKFQVYLRKQRRDDDRWVH